MREIYLIRHGQSTSNAGMVTQHPAASPLTEKGHAQARLLPSLFSQPPELIVTSPYLRTGETARPTIERFPTVPVEEWPVQEFTYLNPLLWKGTTGDERHQATLDYWERNDPFFRDEGGAESFADFLARLDLLRRTIENHPARRIAIFTHGHFSRGFLWRAMNPWSEANENWMRRHLMFMRGLSMPNSSAIIFRFENGLAWNSGILTDHLPADLFSY